jgi:hypothetical protein
MTIKSAYSGTGRRDILTVTRRGCSSTPTATWSGEDLKGGDSFITCIATQRLSKVGDVAEKPYMFMSHGKHDCEDCTDCPDGCFGDDITRLAGTSDIRVGLYEAVPKDPDSDDDRDYI